MQEQDHVGCAPDRLELWGGYECTINRLHDQWHDQTRLSGHEERPEDLDAFASLGITSLRYPALWEKISPRDPLECDFTWTDPRFARLLELGINPIVTLCHHGSGPHYTSLVDDSFAWGLARHAASVAERYPWVRDWTPVNEPLTTARFSALYGYWYPHTLDEALFWRALLNEIDATRLSMRVIRQVNPHARLVQTDDLGYCHATEPLQCEADFQNARRWMGWDLLCGTVVPGHPLWKRLESFGLADRLRAIADDPCPPDIIGINHYLSSERLLDDRIERYPHRSAADRELGDCAGIPYVDIDAMRHLEQPPVGLGGLVRQAWERYGRPIAITEAHNGATRDEQVRWFVEVWQQAQELRSAGVDLRAVTAWALLGSHDWNRMLTRFSGHYEPGVFDVRSGTPRPTLMVQVLKRLARGQPPYAPPLASPGWWRRMRSAGVRKRFRIDTHERVPDGAQPLLIVGDDGPLTHLAMRACENRALHYMITESDLEQAIRQAQPWAVLDARDREGLAGPKRRRDTAHGPRTSVARTCAGLSVPCALFTSAFGPGLAAEALALDGVLVARSGPMFVPWDRQAAPVCWLDALDEGRAISVRGTEPWHAAYAPDVMDVVLDLLMDGMDGPVNLVPAERVSAASVAQSLATAAEHDPAAILVLEGEPLQPQRAALHKGPSHLPCLETTLERFVRECRHARTAGEFAVHPKLDDVRMEDAAHAQEELG